MTQHPPDLPVKPAGVARQEADFTAEGAPPPGKVATSAPATRKPNKLTGVVARNNGPVSRKLWPNPHKPHKR